MASVTIPDAVKHGAPLLAPLVPALAQSGDYRLRLMGPGEDLTAVFRLRYLVFNLELQEGLESAHVEGLDRDAFDAVCDHLVVEHAPTCDIVGTYRLQTGAMAARHLGYYSEQEFDFSPYEPLRDRMVELGRACIHLDHRTFEVLNLLWRGIALYARQQGARYLVGCSSLTSQDPRSGSAIYHKLVPFLVDEEWRTQPTSHYSFPLDPPGDSQEQPPKLLRTYLVIGAQICGPPALDRGFRTIDFLTMLDLERLSPAARARFLEG